MQCCQSHKDLTTPAATVRQKDAATQGNGEHEAAGNTDEAGFDTAGAGAKQGAVGIADDTKVAFCLAYSIG